VAAILWTAVLLAGAWAGTGAAAGLPAMHVESIHAWAVRLPTGWWTVKAEVTVRDMEYMPVEGAAVIVGWSVPPGAGGPQQRVETDAHGIARFCIRAVERGLYRVCVANVEKTGMLYEPAASGPACASALVR